MTRLSGLNVKRISKDALSFKGFPREASHDTDEPNVDMGYPFRLQNVPSESAPDVIIQFFEKRGCMDLKLLSLCANATSLHDTAPQLTAVFSVPIASMKTFKSIVDGTNMEADDDFCGFTPLYQPPEQAIIDFVAIPGLACNSFETWTSDYQTSSGIWLQDQLPRSVPKARILLYGHDYDQPRGELGLIESLATRLRNDLLALHKASDDEERPMVLLAHSTGCLILKRALCHLTDLIDKGVIQFVTFLGAPHDGLDYISSRMLADLQATPAESREFMHGSPETVQLNASFSDIAEKLKISAFYETRNTKFLAQNLAQNHIDDGMSEGLPTDALLVPSTSATLFGRTVVSADADHFGLAQLVEGDKHFGVICDILLSVINIRLKPGGWKVPTTKTAWYMAPAFNAFTNTADEDAVTVPEESSGTSESLSTRRKLLHAITPHKTSESQSESRTESQSDSQPGSQIELDPPQPAHG